MEIVARKRGVSIGRTGQLIRSQHKYRVNNDLHGPKEACTDWQSGDAKRIGNLTSALGN